MTEQERFTAAVRVQTAVVRAIADELRRSNDAPDRDRGLQRQVIEESARLVSVMTDPTRTPTPRAHSNRIEGAAPGAAPRGVRRRLLVVDDEDATRSALARWFERDYDVTVACDGEEGLAAAAIIVPDAIVADVWMPKLDGVAMVHRIKEIERLARIPVVFLTGQTAAESVAAGFSVGAVSYLVKPVDLNLLDTAVRAALGGSGGIRGPEALPR